MRTLLALVAILPLAAEVVEPQPQPQPPTTVTTEEQRANRKMFFERMDANKDGRIELAELQSYYSQPAAPDRSRELFKRLDADNSGQLSPEEFAALANVLTMSRPPVAPGNQAMRAQESLRRWDGNNDGAVTLEEFESANARPQIGPRPIAPPKPDAKPEQ